MHKHDFNRVRFHSKEDMAAGHHLAKGECILRDKRKSNYTDINDILEVYNVKKYIDNNLYLANWTEEDIINFKKKGAEYGKAVGRFISDIDDRNITELYQEVLQGYINSFWELVNNQNAYNRISKDKFETILFNEPHTIHTILTHKNLVDYYDSEIKAFLLIYSQSAEILLSIYEIQNDFRENQMFIPKSLTIEDKERIISRYLDSNDANWNFIGLIENVRTQKDFKISDKTKLKAKRLNKIKTERFFNEKSGIRYGVCINFIEDATKIKDCFIDDNLTGHCLYSLDFVKQNNNPYSLFQCFKYLFEYLDEQNRISLVSKRNQMGLFERFIGVHSQNEYRGGTAFSLSEMTSHAQIFGYSKIIGDLGNSLEKILNFIFTSAFQERYNFANNARFTIPTATNSYFEKVRLLAPEFESLLKQFKLFAEDGNIDFELLQISSAPSAIRDIPSLNQNKYIYFNEDNKEMCGCLNLFFSDQTLLTYVEPFKEKQYQNFFDLLANEQVSFSNYEEHQKPEINYLMDKGFISIDSADIIQITNNERLLIFKDLYDNEFASFYHYPINFQKEVKQMALENIVLFDDSLFAKPEQAYFNYFLNKKEFTNGLDLRNSYLHGTQANPEEVSKHEYSYFIYLKLLILAMLKIEDDLLISSATKILDN